MVMVTHDLEVAGNASRIIRMKDGRIVSAGEKDPTPELQPA